MKPDLPTQRQAADGAAQPPPDSPPLIPLAAFDEADREAVYRAIFTRRDVRGEFLPDPVPDETVTRILTAAHHAPSVGLSQPWNFLVIRSAETRRRIAAIFAEANAEAAAMFAGERGEKYRALKLEGIQSSALNICVTCDTGRAGLVLGATHMADMQLFSTVCAVQNLWLAARAEGLGVGWVSILKEDQVKAVLGIPPEVRIVAYLCVGRVSGAFERPELEVRGWGRRQALADMVWDEHWGRPAE